MKQPFFSFILYFKRFEEVKIIRERATRLRVNISKLDFLEGDDIKTFNQMFMITTNLKHIYVFKPFKKHKSIKNEIKQLQISLKGKQSQIKSTDEWEYVNNLFQTTKDYLRLEEIFEQNIMFMVFLVMALIAIIFPIIYSLVF